MGFVQVMGAFSRRIKKWAFDVDAEHRCCATGAGLADGCNRSRGHGGCVGDDGGKHARGAKAAVRVRDGANDFSGGSIVQQGAAASCKAASP